MTATSEIENKASENLDESEDPPGIIILKKIFEDKNNGRVFHNSLNGLFYSYMIHDSDKEDILQDSYFNAYNCAEDYYYSLDESIPLKKDGNLRGWLYGIIKNKTRDYNRKRRRKHEIPVSQLENEDFNFLEESNNRNCRNCNLPENKIIEEELKNKRMNLINENLPKLNNNHREFLIRKYFLNQKYKEIAESEEIPIRTVKS